MSPLRPKRSQNQVAESNGQQGSDFKLKRAKGNFDVHRDTDKENLPNPDSTPIRPRTAVPAQPKGRVPLRRAERVHRAPRTEAEKEELWRLDIEAFSECVVSVRNSGTAQQHEAWHARAAFWYKFYSSPTQKEYPERPPSLALSDIPDSSAVEKHRLKYPWYFPGLECYVRQRYPPQWRYYVGGMSPETPNQTQSVVQHTAQGNDFWKLSSAEMNYQLDEEIKQIKETEAALVKSEQKLRDLQQRIEDLRRAKEQRLRIREHHVIVAKLKKEDEALAKTST